MKPGTIPSLPAMLKVLATKAVLDEATKRARATGETFRLTGEGLRLAEAYAAWMQARAASGDSFALSLGYGIPCRKEA